MFVRLVANTLACGRPTTMPLPLLPRVREDRDEVYFTLTGATTQRPIEVPRVSPPPPEDYYGLHAGRSASDILLWEGFVGDNEDAYVVVAVREQDNAEIGTLGHIITGAAAAVGAILTADPALGATALASLREAATSFVTNLAIGANETIGAFTARIHVQGPSVTTTWTPLATTTIVTSSAQAATLHLSGAGASYTLNLSAERSRLPMIVSKNSGKCLDVVGLGLNDGVTVQQYTPNGGENQRWLLKWVGIRWIPAAGYIGPACAIIANHSGKCLDVPNGSLQDGEDIQQYTPHFGDNQLWGMVPLGSDLAFVNVKSGKALDVEGASKADGANVQQYQRNSQPNQRWILKA
jgi:hypothetical protein